MTTWTEITIFTRMLYIIIICTAALSALVTWVLTRAYGKTSSTREIAEKDNALTTVRAELAAEKQLRECEREHAAAHCEELRQTFDKTVRELKENQTQIIAAARNELAIENEKRLKEREESLRKEAEETMKHLTGGLDQNIKAMKDAFEAQKKSHSEESSAIKTKLDETVNQLRRETTAIGNQAADLASALKGQNKMQGIFGETILENILRKEGFTEGRDYDSECWLRSRTGEIIKNEETGKKMRPDFALHFPDDTDILIDAKVSLSALSDYFRAETDEARADASGRNLKSVMSHIRELTAKDYQKHVEGRKTLDYVIMFIPNYGAYQLAKQEDPEIFSKAFSQNVLITTEETLIPFLRLIRSAWVQKGQQDNMKAIIDAAQKMVEKVAIFAEKNAEVEREFKKVSKLLEDNTRRLNSRGSNSIFGAAKKVISCGITSKRAEEFLQITEAIGDNGTTDNETIDTQQ